MGTLKRPTSLSRNPSAAGFPIQSWVFSKGAGKSVIAQSPSPETPEATVAIEVEDIPSLLRMVERFAKAVEKLKDVVLEGMIMVFLEKNYKNLWIFFFSLVKTSSCGCQNFNVKNMVETF